jgi:ribosomal protein L37AE/L43A
MALQRCPECKGQVSSTAEKCPHCGKTLKIRVPADGSMGVCPKCLIKMDQGTGSKNKGLGLVILIIGIVLAPIIVGIPVAVFGLYLMFKSDGYWVCRKCGAKFYQKA